MDEETDSLRDIIRDELKRMRIRSHLLNDNGESRNQRRMIWRVLDHPFGKIIFGFVLTGIVGQWLSESYALRKEQDLLRRSALESIREFSSAEQNLRQRYVSIRASILLGRNINTLIKQKEKYEEARVKWHSNLQSQRLKFRELFGYTRRHYIEAVIDNLLSPNIRQLHICLSDSFDSFSNGDNKSAIMHFKKCGKSEIDSQKFLDANFSCSYELTSTISHFIMTDMNCGSKQWKNSGSGVYKAFIELCLPKKSLEERNLNTEEKRFLESKRVWKFGSIKNEDKKFLIRNEGFFKKN